MSNPSDNYNLFGQNSNSTIGQLSLGIASSTINPHSLDETNFVKVHGTVDVNLSLGSGKPLTSTHQTMPGQLDLHVGEGRIRRSNLMMPCGARTHSTCDSRRIQPQNPLNINIIVGNNSSLNINLLNNNTPCQYTKITPCAPSSSVERVRKNVISTVTSNFDRPFSDISSNWEPILDRCPKISDSCHLIESCSKLTSSPTNDLESHALGTSTPNEKEKVPIGVDQTQESSQINNLQSNSNLNLFNLLTSYLHNEKHSYVPALPSLTENPIRKGGIASDGGNKTFHGNELISQRNLLNRLRNLPTPIEQARDQLCDHNSINRCPPSRLSAYYQVSHPTRITRPQRNMTQASNANHVVDFNSRARKRQRPAGRHKSHRCTKNGPYACPRCHAIFESGYRFASHMHKHYRDESPAERKKRREGKIKKRDLCIAQSTHGMTVIPKSLESDDRLLVKSKINDDKATKTKEREHFACAKVKEELIED